MAVTYLGDNGPDGMCTGLTASEKVAFHGSTPVVQASAITLTSGSLGDANTAVNAILTALRAKGLIAT